MNPSQDSRLRLTLATLAIAVLALGASAKSGAEKQKSLAERMYDNRVKRCKAMMGKDEMSRCDVRSGTTYDEKLRGLHRTMMDRITKAQPADGTCSKYSATYLVCDEKMLGGKMMYTIYPSGPREGRLGQLLDVRLVARILELRFPPQCGHAAHWCGEPD